MKSKIVLTTLALCALFASTAVIADKDSDTDRSHPGNFVKDSAITKKIKSKIAAEHITSLGRIHVDTDKDGVVWLSGTRKIADGNRQGRVNSARYGTCCLGSQ
jgi:hyperosmotically inducible protein